MTPSRFTLLDTSEKVLTGINPDIVRNSLLGVSQWLKAAVDASGNPGKCCRNAMYHEDGRVSWIYANSNTAELISAWLDLAELIGEPALVDRATAYADTLLNDPVRGLYQGEKPEARGLVWYWTDAGTYTGLYAMRMPTNFYRLHKKTGDSRYLDICDVIGRVLLSRQLDSGIVSAAWSPTDGWMHEVRVGIRYVYATATFATLWRITGDEAYRIGYEKALSAMLGMQNPDGSFFQMYDPRTAKPLDSSIKLHFTAYVLNALAEAHAITGDDALVECAHKLANHLAGVFYYHHTTPYCVGHVGEPADRMEAESSIQDSSAGLFWLAELSGETMYRDMAAKLWNESWIHQLPLDRATGWAGAILRGVKPGIKETINGVPTNRKHLHYDPTIIARSDLWFAVNHVFASRRLLSDLQARASVTAKEPRF